MIENTPVGILYKSTVGRYRPVRIPDGPIMARFRYIKNAIWDGLFNKMLRKKKKGTNGTRLEK